jgi:tetratricopeptide (TPR) repeat protein
VRHGYAWAHPVHECLQWNGKGREVIQDTNEIELHHYQNAQTSRQQYLPLLEMSVKEDPSDDRNSHYLAREYMYTQPEKCIAEAMRHLSLPKAVWTPERAMSCSFIARSYETLGRWDLAEQWFLRAIAEFQDRDHWIRLAFFYLKRQFWAGAYAAAVRGLQFTQRPSLYLSDPQCWGAWPEDIAGCAAFQLGLAKECQAHYDRAVALAPQDERIAKDRACALELLDSRRKIG